MEQAHYLKGGCLLWDFLLHLWDYILHFDDDDDVDDDNDDYEDDNDDDDDEDDEEEEEDDENNDDNDCNDDNFDFTHFSGDLIGLGLAWCSLLPIFILVGFGTLILFRRDIHTVSYIHIFNARPLDI